MSHAENEATKPRIHIRTSVRLTGPEFRMLGSIADGHGRKSVAEEMGVDREQIRFHLSKAYAKLKVKNIHAAVQAAQDLGILPLDPHGSL